MPRTPGPWLYRSYGPTCPTASKSTAGLGQVNFENATGSMNRNTVIAHRNSGQKMIQYSYYKYIATRFYKVYLYMTYVPSLYVMSNMEI